jgi:EAL domain-containing protein (putative c-di-GMP-specific phosphodiesterase class I)
LFVKVTTSGPRRYVQLVQSYRDEAGRVKKRTVATLGRLDQLTGELDGVIVQTIIGMARNLGLEVIAEGVETHAQKDYLAANGCGLYQGYLLGKPMPLAQFEAVLKEPTAA